MKVDILAFGAHPDDIELSCAGTLLKHIDMGHTVGLVDLTRGELGTRGSADLRDIEAANSAEILGAKFRWNLKMADGFFTHSQENLKSVIQAIRAAKPKIILCNALDDRHIDHGKGAKLVADAAFLSGLVKIETYDDKGQIQDRWRPQAVYHYIQDKNLTPDFVVDITPYMGRKMEMILAFRSQFWNEEDKSNDLQTPISGRTFLDFIKGKGRTFGRNIQVDYAEGFNVARIPGVSDLFSLK